MFEHFHIPYTNLPTSFKVHKTTTSPVTAAHTWISLNPYEGLKALSPAFFLLP